MQGLRAVAVLLVVAHHAGLPLPGGFLGVDVFFVISGFVITRLLTRELAATGRVRFTAFFVRRARRLLPALAVVLLGTLVASVFLQSPFGTQQTTAITAAAAVAWVANAAVYVRTGDYFDADAEWNPLLHTWSLSVEEQFYLLFPLLLVVGWRWRGRSGAAAVVVVTAAVSLALALWLSTAPAASGLSLPREFAFYASVSRAWEFAAGALVALGAGALGRLRAERAGAVAVAGAVLLGGSVVVIDADVRPGVAALLPVVATALLLGAGMIGADNALSRALGAHVLVHVGERSYSWYLWHWPVMVFAGAWWPGRAWVGAVAAGAAFAAASLSYRWVEEPVRHGRVATTRVVALCAGVPVVAAAALGAAATATWWDPAVRTMAAQVRPLPVGYGIGCHSGTPLPDRPAGSCTWNPDATGRTVFLVGDSNAGQYAEGLIEAGAAVGHPVTLATMSACSFTTVSVRTAGVDPAACRRFVDGALALLDRTEPAIVVLGHAGTGITDDRVTMHDPSSGATAVTPAEKQAMWRDGLVRTVAALRRAGHHAVLLQTAPHFRGVDGERWDPLRCSLVAVRRDACGVQRSRSAADADQAGVLTAGREAVAASPGAEVWEVRDALCPAGVCATDDGGAWHYRDGVHISTATSRRLSGVFADRLTSIDRRGPA